jgi:hypothetical protein
MLGRRSLVWRRHVSLGQDERVAVDRIGVFQLGDRQGALAGVQGPPPPRAGIGGHLRGIEADPADQQHRVGGPPVRPVVGSPISKMT